MYRKGAGGQGSYMIFKDVKELCDFLDRKRIENPGLKIITTSGGFDPLHVGHLRCIQESASIKDNLSSGSMFVVIANADGFLMNNKGFVFMPEDERLEILHGLKGVDHVVSWYDGTQTCVGAIEAIEPDIFTKGGDRTSRENIPEADICDVVGCEIIFNVGGGKIQSSSWLTEKKQ